MSVDTIERISPVTPEIGELSAEDVRQRWEAIVAAETSDEAAEEQLSYAKIVELFADKHSENISDLHDKQEVLLETMLDNPATAFHGEFLQLQLLFENRTIHNTAYNGARVSEFCTQNHVNNTIDHLFRYTVSPEGSESFEVSKVTDIYGEPAVVKFRWDDGNLAITSPHITASRRVEMAVSPDKHKRLLEQLFVETIHASSVQFERSPDELVENDERAKSYLTHMQEVQKTPKLYHRVVDGQSYASN